jgi:hypothetical protein
MTISAPRRFIDLIGADRLDHGSLQTERGLYRDQTLEPFLNGKEAVIMSILHPRQALTNPYLPNSIYDRAYASGCAIERADLADVVQRYKI